MINRDIIRTKIVQLVYSYYQNNHNGFDTAEKELLFSLTKAHHLYQQLLALIVALTHEARRVYDIEQNRSQREGTPAPSDKFINNRLAVMMEENIQLREFVDTQKSLWDAEYDCVCKLYQQMHQSELMAEYLGSDIDSFEEDQEIWRRLYKTFIQNNEELDNVIEEHSLYWNDDKETVDTFVLKTIKRFSPENGAEQELLPEFKDEEDRDFALKLFRATINNGEDYQRYMADASRNWDFSRLAYMDIVIMQIAIAEMMSFPNIPVNVTINEYVELAKIYSTPRSGGYINGMLDSIARHLHDNGMMLKPVPERKKFVKKNEN